MKIYGRSLPIGFRGVVVDQTNRKLKICNHPHLTRSSAESCGKKMARKYLEEIHETEAS